MWLACFFLFFLEDGDIYKAFLDRSAATWEKAAKTHQNYTVKIRWTTRIDGQADSVTEGNMLFKRRGDLAVYERWDDRGVPVMAIGINKEYSFIISRRGDGPWSVGTAGDEEKILKRVYAEFNGMKANPDRDPLLVAGNFYLPAIPWDTSKVTCLNSESVDDTHVKLHFAFDIEETPVLKNAHLLRKSEVTFLKDSWLPVSSRTDYRINQDFAYDMYLDTERDDQGRVQRMTQKLVVRGGDNMVAFTEIEYLEWMPVADSSEFRLPHYGLPEYKAAPRSIARWIVVAGVAVLILVGLYFRKSWSQST